MRRHLFVFNLVLFLIVWLGITAYTLLSLFNRELPYSVELFALFLFILDVLALPLIWLWYTTREKTIQLKTAVASTAVIFIFYWGPFAPVHSIISLHLSDLQLRWIAFVYIWEVVLVGAAVLYAVLLVTRFGDRFLKGQLEKTHSPERMHAHIATIPLRAGVVFTIVVLLGYVIGSAQLFSFAQLPLTEVVKNLINGVIAGVLSAHIILFLVERIIKPALKKSGGLIDRKNVVKRQGQLSLFTRIYVVFGLLVLVSMGFFGTMAYARGQIILEEQLKERILLELAVVNIQREKTGTLPDEKETSIRFGTNGQLFILPRSASMDDPIVFPDQPALYGDIFTTWSRTLDSPHLIIDRNSRTKIAGTFPINDHEMLAAIVFLEDFDDALNSLIFYILFVFFVVGVMVAVIGTFFARSITVPMGEIKEGGIRLGKGDFSEPITVYTNDELEDLSNALNEASLKLQSSYDRLEEEIRERTQELAKANVKQEEQIKELDRASKLLVKRDFELQQANNLLREMDQAKTQFVSVAAHQLRTPLSVSKWTYQMLLSEDFGALTQEQKEVLERGDTMNEQMIHLVSDLLDVARIESGRVVYDFEPIELRSFLMFLQDLYRERSEEKHVSLTIDLPEEHPVMIKGDEIRMKMIFQNLLDNAFKFTREGGSIRVSWQPKGKMIEFKIEDTGIGITKEELPRLFSKFFRAKNAMLMDTSGTGLGLYIVSSIVHTHGGNIWVESQEGKGTTFFFTLPLIINQ